MAPTSPWLADALRAGATGVHSRAAGTILQIDNGAWLHREDFSPFVALRTYDGIPTAVISWEGAITALNGGELPCSSGEARILRLAASLAAGIPVSLGDALTGFDDRNTSLAITAVAHTTGHTRPWWNRGPPRPPSPRTTPDARGQLPPLRRRGPRSSEDARRHAAAVSLWGALLLWGACDDRDVVILPAQGGRGGSVTDAGSDDDSVHRSCGVETSAFRPGRKRRPTLEHMFASFR